MRVSNQLPAHTDGALSNDPAIERWVRHGSSMARREGSGAFESVSSLHQVETKAARAKAGSLKTHGQMALRRYEELKASRDTSNFDHGEHLKALARGRADLLLAIVLGLITAALNVMVLLAFGPTLLAGFLAFAFIASTVAIERFFEALEREDVLMETIWMVCGVLVLAAQFWLGSLRGVFLTAVAPEAVGPATEALRAAGPILKYGLGLLAVACEFTIGFLVYRWRSQCCSATAHTTREIERLADEMQSIQVALKTVETEPEIRRACREIGVRQYLHQALSAEEQHRRTHLKRAALYALIALVVIILSLALVEFAYAAPAGRNVVVLIDLTKSTRAETLAAHIGGVGDVINLLDAHDRIIVTGVTNSFGEPAILLDSTLPDQGYLGVQLRAGRELLTAQWKKRAAALTPKYDESDLLGALTLVSHLGLVPTHLVIFSDLRQSSSALNLEQMPRINVDQALTRVDRAAIAPRLEGTTIYLLGVDPAGVTGPYFEDLKRFWCRFFEKTGAHVQVFAITHQVLAFGDAR